MRPSQPLARTDVLATCLHGMISDRIDRVYAIHSVHCGTVTPKRIPLRLGGFRRVRVLDRDPSLDRARCPACERRVTNRHRNSQ